MSAYRSPLAFALIASIALAPAWAYDPPAGAEALATLSSPTMLSGGSSAASMDSPMSDLVNPAGSGLLQRTTLDVSYAALVGLGAETGWGHVINAGLAVPT